MMRRTVRSVGGAPGLGSRCLKSVMTVAFAQPGSERSASIVGASVVLMRAARAMGRALAISSLPGSAAAIAAAISGSAAFAARSAEKALPQKAQEKPASATAFEASTIRLRRTCAAPRERRRSHRYQKPMQQSFGLEARPTPRGRRRTDAWYAALASEWITMARDYARFPGLRWAPRRPSYAFVERYLGSPSSVAPFSARSGRKASESTKRPMSGVP